MSAASAARARPTLTVCTLCTGDTLGEGDGRPGGQAARVAELAATGCAQVRQVECLDVCESDVVRVTPPPRRHRADARAVWLSGVAGDGPTAALAAYLRAGGPGAGELPASLRALVVPAPG